MNYTWLVPLEYYIYILYYEDDDDHRETFWAKWAIDHRRYMILNWMWNKSKNFILGGLSLFFDVLEGLLRIDLAWVPPL